MYGIRTIFLQEPDDAELSDEQETPHPDENPPGYQARQSPQQGTSTKPEGGTTSQQPKQEGSTNQQFQNNHVNSTHNAQQVQAPIVPHDQIVNQLNNQNNSQTGENPDTGEEEKKKTNKEWRTTLSHPHPTLQTEEGWDVNSCLNKFCTEHVPNFLYVLFWLFCMFYNLFYDEIPKLNDCIVKKNLIWTLCLISNVIYSGITAN